MVETLAGAFEPDSLLGIDAAVLARELAVGFFDTGCFCVRGGIVLTVLAKCKMFLHKR